MKDTENTGARHAKLSERRFGKKAAAAEESSLIEMPTLTPKEFKRRVQEAAKQAEEQAEKESVLVELPTRSPEEIEARMRELAEAEKESTLVETPTLSPREFKRRVQEAARQAEEQAAAESVLIEITTPEPPPQEKRRFFRKKTAAAAGDATLIDFSVPFAKSAEAAAQKSALMTDAETANDPAAIPEGIGHYPSIDRLRTLLMLPMCITLFGFPTMVGGLLKTFCGFSWIAYFLLSGFLVLREPEGRSERIVRSIKRSALVFGILTVAYFAISFLLDSSILVYCTDLRFWFNFLVMNVWQFSVGGAIWYVQALLYAYIILYFLNKWNLLKYDWLIAAILIAFTVITGELSGLLPWSVAGYTYVPGNFFTRALPYILLGGILYKNIKALAAVPRFVYKLGLFVGLFLVFAEILVLGIFNKVGYYGHLIGMPVTALSCCMLALQNDSPDPGFEAKLGINRWHTCFMYYFCHPVGMILTLLLLVLFGEALPLWLLDCVGIFTFVICFLLAWPAARIGRAREKEAPSAAAMPKAE